MESIPHAMIDGIRRRFAESIDKDPWDTELELEPEVEAEETEVSAIPTDTAVILAATRMSTPSASNDFDSGEYYKSIVKTAIQNGGKYGEHQIPVPWLRMILAGLEWRHVDPEMMWYGVEAGDSGSEGLPEIPSYSDLFPSERDLPEGPAPN
jgi:hypothetical protein